MILPKDTDLFHVHTFRCKHAEETGDEEYIKKAIKLGKTGIWFTDHAPFPGNKPEFGFFQKYDMILPLHKTNQEN